MIRQPAQQNYIKQHRRLHIISCINYLVLRLGLGLILYNFAELAAGPIDTGFLIRASLREPHSSVECGAEVSACIIMYRS